MAGKVHYIYGQPTPIGHFVRVGYNGHRQLETLFARGRFAPDRVVIDAARFDTQRELINTLSATGTEIVIDPTVAELSSVGRFEGASKGLAWANKTRPLDHGDFQGAEEGTVARRIADFAAARNVDTVLAPTHLLEGAHDQWVSIDARSPLLLRDALDRAGRSDIAIDYQLIIPYRVLRNSAHRRVLVGVLRSLPFDNLWIRVAGFGADATPFGVRRYISSLSDFHVTQRPIIADCAGGLAALGVAAFGAAAGIAHGVAERERFDAGAWRRQPKDGGGGQNGRLYLPGIDRHLKLADVRAIMDARGARRLLACQDRDCCPRGLVDMLNDPKAHFLTQRRKQLLDLQRMPDLRRTSRFLDNHLASADRTARQVAKLKIPDDRIQKLLRRATLRLDRLRGVLEDLDGTLGGSATRSLPLATHARVDGRVQDQRS